MSVRMRSNLGAVRRSLERQSRDGLEAIALELQGEARRRTPVDTGRLQASLAWAVDGETRQHDGEAEGRDGTVRVSYTVTAPPNAARVGTNVEYAVEVHENLHGNIPRPGGVGQPKFLESAGHDLQDRFKALMLLAMQGRLKP